MLHADQRGGLPTAIKPTASPDASLTTITPGAGDLYVQVRTHDGLELLPLSQALGLHADGLLPSGDYEDVITGHLGLTVVVMLEDGGAL